MPVPRLRAKIKVIALMALLINGELVNDSVIRQETAALRQQVAGAIEGDPVEIEMRLREQAQENVIDRTLLRQEAAKDPEPIAVEQIEQALTAVRSQSAVKAGCDPRADDDELRREIEARLRVDRLLGKIAARLARPRPKDVGEYYRKHRDQFHMPELLRASHIVKNVDENTTEEAALAAIREVQAQLNGGNFAELADQHSDCRGNGGDLGYFPRGQMVDEFDAAVFAMQPGQTSDVFRTQFGFHIAKLVERRAAGIRPLPEVKDEIEGLLHRQKLQRAVDDLLDRLRDKAEVQNVRQKIQA
jgi:parvulin-like peptidyl-prolyl isomerase